MPSVYNHPDVLCRFKCGGCNRFDRLLRDEFEGYPLGEGGEDKVAFKQSKVLSDTVARAITEREVGLAGQASLLLSAEPLWDKAFWMGEDVRPAMQ